MKQLQLKHWQDPVVALLGAWFAVSPWVLGFEAHTAAKAASLVLGLLLLAVGLAAVFAPRSWEHWSTVALGVLAAVSPWLLGFAGQARAMENAVAVGLVSLVLALWALARDDQLGGWWHDRMAH